MTFVIVRYAAYAKKDLSYLLQTGIVQVGYAGS